MPDRLDDRLVIDACDGHMDGDLVRARRNIEGLLDTIVFVQALDDIAAVVEHETVAPLAIVALFQDQRAVFGLDNMGHVAVHDAGLPLVVHQPDVIGIDLHGLALTILQLREVTCHGRRQDDVVVATVFYDMRRIFRFLELYRAGARAAFHLGHIKDDLLRVGRAIRVRHRDGEVFLALRPGLELLVFFTERVHHIGVLTGLGIDGQVAEFSLDGLQTVLGRSSRISIIHAVAQFGVIPLPYIIHVLAVGRALHRVPVLDLDRMFCRNGLPVRSPELQGRSIVHPVDGDGDAACDALSAGIARDRKVFLHGRMGAILVQILQLVTAFFSQLIGVGQAAVFIACDGQGPVLALGLPGTVACQINRLPALGSDARDMLFIPGIRVRDRDRLDVDGVSGILRDGRRTAGDTGSIILPRDLEGQFLFFRDGIVFIKHHHGERGFTDIARPQMLRGLVVEDKGVFTGLLVQLQIAVFAGLRAHVAHGAIFTRDLDQVLEDAPLACRTAVRAVHVRSAYLARDGLGATVLHDACDRKAVIRDIQPCLPLIHRDARHFRGIVAALDGDLQRLVGPLSIALPRPLGMDGEIIIPDLSALQGIGRVTVVVQLVEILAGRRVEIERAVLSLHDLDVGIRAPGFLRELLADGILDLGSQRTEVGEFGLLPTLRLVDGELHLMRCTVRIRVIILGFQLAMRRRRPVRENVLLLGIRVGHDASFHHRDHCRVAYEDRGRVLAGDGDGDVLHIPGALVVTHGHMESQLFFLSFRQADDRFAFRIQIEGILAGGGIDLEGAELIAERRRHVDAFGISPVQAPKIRIRQQAVGELVPRVGIFGADLPGNRNHALIQTQVRGVLDLRRIIGTVDGKLLRSRRLRRGAMLVTNIEVDRKVELHILAIRRQCRPGFIRIQQAQGILSRRRIERQFGYGHPVEGKGHRSSATPHRGRQCRIAYPAHLVHEIGESRIPGIDIAGRKLPFHGLGLIGRIFFGIELRLVWRRDRDPVFLAAHTVSIDVLGRPSRDLDGRTVVGTVDIDGGRMFTLGKVAVLVLDLERDIDAQIHVLRQTVQPRLGRYESIGQVAIRPVLLQPERAQHDGLAFIDSGDDGRQRVGTIGTGDDAVYGALHGRPTIRYCQ